MHSIKMQNHFREKGQKTKPVSFHIKYFENQTFFYKLRLAVHICSKIGANLFNIKHFIYVKTKRYLMNRF